MPIRTIRKPAAGRPRDRQRPEVEHPQHAGQHPDLANPDVLRNHPIPAVEPAVALAQERKGEDPEQWRHKARDQ
jgi:hypothetical protein